MQHPVLGFENMKQVQAAFDASLPSVTKDKTAF